MSYEDIEVRITKSGKIFIKVDGMDEARLRDFRTFLEETLGPISSAVVINRPDWEKPVELSEDQKRQQELER